MTRLSVITLHFAWNLDVSVTFSSRYSAFMHINCYYIYDNNILHKLKFSGSQTSICLYKSTTFIRIFNSEIKEIIVYSLEI